MKKAAGIQLGEVDLHSIGCYHERGYPWEEWALLREHAPVYWYERDGIQPFWAITRYEDVKRISLDDRTFINGGPRLRLADDNFESRRLYARQKRIEERGWDPEEPEDFVFMDNPVHRDFRLICARRFTSAYCRSLAIDLQSLAEDIVSNFESELKQGEDVDLVEALSVKLPLATICRMMGLPEDDWQDIHRWTDALLDLDNMRWARPDERRYDMRKRLHVEFYEYLEDIIARKRARPGDDLSSILVNAEIDGRRLTQQQLHGYLRLLIAAGNETTRNAVTRGALLLMDHPGERTYLEEAPAERVAGLVEEVIRYTSPVIQFARTVTRDITLHGQSLRAGDTVGIWYPSANRDPRVFESPDTFNIRRDPNPHLGFGRGVHFCLGANLARFELRALFQSLGEWRLLGRIQRAGAMRRLTDLHVGAVAELPVRLRY